MRQDPAVGRQKLFERYANEIRTILNKVDKAYWPTIMKLTGCKEVMEAIPEDPITLEEASLDDLERLKRLSVRAMEAGMTGPNPNAQIIRAFHAWSELREGQNQLEGLQIHVTPAEVPDIMSDMLRIQIEELTEIASRA